MPEKKFPTIIGILLLIAGLVSGIFLIQQSQTVRIGASMESLPKNVRITNITDKTFAVSWTTDKKTLGFVKWKPASGAGVAQDSLDNGLSHLVLVKNLYPNIKYDFSIVSDGNEFDNNGIPWGVKTGQRLLPNPNSSFLSGIILSPIGSPVSEALVYAFIGGTQLSTITKQDGSWTLPLSSARNGTLSNYLNLENDTTVEFMIQTGSGDVTSAISQIADANPLPPITLGKQNDFRNADEVNDGFVPEARIELPNTEIKSRFVIEDTSKQ